MLDVPSYILGKKSSGSSQSEEYSTTERRVGTWIGGEPLYQKTFIIQNLPDNSSTSVAHGLTNVNKIIDANGTACKSNPLNCVPLPYYTASQYSTIFYFIDDTNITVTTTGNRRDYSVYITVRYTKTTD